MTEDEEKAALCSDLALGKVLKGLSATCNDVHTLVPHRKLVHAVCVFFIMDENDLPTGCMIGDTVGGDAKARLSAAMAMAAAAEASATQGGINVH